MQNNSGITGNPRRPLALHSAKFLGQKKKERNYPVGEQELLAVVSTLKESRFYLEGAKGCVTIVTAHLPNIFLNTKSVEQFSRRQVRWQIDLSRINPKWVYEKGPTNVANPLSCCPGLLHVARTQANPCAHDVINSPVMDRAFRKSDDLGSQSPPMGRANSPTETTAYADVGPAFLAIIAEHPVPDGI